MNGTFSDEASWPRDDCRFAWRRGAMRRTILLANRLHHR